IKEFAAQHDRQFQGISAEAMEILMSYPWPGNVRELRNLVESMVVLAPGREIGPEDIPRAIREGGSARFLPVHVGPVVRGAIGADREGGDRSGAQRDAGESAESGGDSRHRRAHSLSKVARLRYRARSLGSHALIDEPPHRYASIHKKSERTTPTSLTSRLVIFF